MAVVTYTGENDQERLAAVEKAADKFVAKYTDMGLERLDGEEATYEQMLGAVQSVPFLAECKLVVLKRPGANKIFVEKFENFISEVSESVDVMIVESKVDKRTAYYKQLKKLTEFHEFKELDAQNLAQWAAGYAKDQGGNLGLADARYLVSRIGDTAHVEKRTGADQLLVRNEIDKLLSYDQKITKQSIELLTEEAPQSRVFDLLDAAFRGNVARTMELYDDQREQGVEPQQIIAMLVWQLYIFVLIKAARSRSVADIAREAKISPFVVEKSQTVVRSLTLGRLREMVTELRKLDVRGKSESIILDEALRYYLVTLV